jgi:hypothetical protein
VRLVTNHKVSQVGISEFLTAPDEAVITFHGKGYTSPERVIEMAALRCADATLAHGYHYFVITSATDMSRHSLFGTPGYAQTYGNATAFGNFAIGTATTTFTPPKPKHQPTIVPVPLSETAIAPRVIRRALLCLTNPVPREQYK